MYLIKLVMFQLLLPVDSEVQMHGLFPSQFIQSALE